MAWLAANWFWVVIGIAFIAMHLFGHGGHSGHSHGSHQSGTGSADSGAPADDHTKPHVH